MRKCACARRVGRLRSRSRGNRPGGTLNALDWYGRGYDCLKENDLDGARRAFENALSGEYGTLKPATRAGVLRALGRLAEGRGDAEAAIAYYQAALIDDPEIGVRKRLGVLLRARERR